ncbi:hypothetical protein ACU5AX_09010 [Sphingomonas sp. XXL09]|uniref:hypothetical protein n=1 Tax=Sphingomonas sp. XXL09 TaxID=3457787 RepID=UPI00406BCB8E
MVTHNKPSDVVAEEGRVLVDGPDGVAVALTPMAAVSTSDRLHDAATEAFGQQRMQEAADAATKPKDQARKA